MKTPEEWLKEFYPIEADLVEKQDAVEHSLNKWRGLRELASHGLKHLGWYIQTDEADPRRILEIDSDSCALCQHHFNLDDDCPTCPISRVRTGYPCDHILEGKENISPYMAFIEASDPEPMIRLLELALEYEKKEKANESVNS